MRSNHWHECVEGRCMIPSGSTSTSGDSYKVHRRADPSDPDWGETSPYDFTMYGGYYEGCATGWLLSDFICRGEPMCGSIGPYGNGCTVDDDCVAVQQGMIQLKCTNGECVMPYGTQGFCHDRAQLMCDGTCYKSQCVEGAFRRTEDVASDMKCNSGVNIREGDRYYGQIYDIAQEIPESGFLSCRQSLWRTVCVYTADCPEANRVAASDNEWRIFQTVEETCGNGECSEWERQEGTCVRDCGSCRNFCETSAADWSKKCNWVNCNGCSSCQDPK